MTVDCPRCGKSCPIGPHHSAHCSHCFTSWRTDHEPRLPYACRGCGQLQDHLGLCPRCHGLEREPQGQAVRLFEPAPTQIPGQLGLV